MVELGEINIEKQSRDVCVKCQTDGELPAGRRAEVAYGTYFASRCCT